jgi:hypothetical protein
MKLYVSTPKAAVFSVQQWFKVSDSASTLSVANMSPTCFASSDSNRINGKYAGDMFATLSVDAL